MQNYVSVVIPAYNEDYKIKEILGVIIGIESENKREEVVLSE